MMFLLQFTIDIVTVPTFGVISGGCQLAMGKYIGGKLAEIDDCIFKIAYINF
jgi:hypothetical protein